MISPASAARMTKPITTTRSSLHPPEAGIRSGPAVGVRSSRRGMSSGPEFERGLEAGSGPRRSQNLRSERRSGPPHASKLDCAARRASFRPLAGEPDEGGAEGGSEDGKPRRVGLEPVRDEGIGNRHCSGNPAENDRAQSQDCRRAADDPGKDEAAEGDDRYAQNDPERQEPETSPGDRRKRHDIVEAHRRVGEHDDRRGGDEITRGAGGRGTFVAGLPGAHVEGDDDQRPRRDELDQRHGEKGVGEGEHAEPQRDRPDRAEHHRTARFLRRQP